MLTLRPATADDLQDLTEWEAARAYGYHGARGVWLDVKAGNQRARTLYESTGFIIVRTLSAAVAGADGSLSGLVVMTHQPW